MRLACARYPKARSPSNCLYHVLKEHVLPHACQIDADVFRERLHSDVVRSVQLKHRKNLKTVFKVFASWDSASPASTMDADEMVVMLRFAKVIGPLCSEMACRTIFAYVQNDDVVIQDLKMDGTVGTHRSRSREAVEMPGSDVEMVYTEFEECLAAIASMLQPDPRVAPAPSAKTRPRTERRSGGPAQVQEARPVHRELPHRCASRRPFFLAAALRSAG